MRRCHLRRKAIDVDAMFTRLNGSSGINTWSSRTRNRFITSKVIVMKQIGFVPWIAVEMMQSKWKTPFDYFRVGYSSSPLKLSYSRDSWLRDDMFEPSYAPSKTWNFVANGNGQVSCMWTKKKKLTNFLFFWSLMAAFVRNYALLQLFLFLVHMTTEWWIRCNNNESVPYEASRNNLRCVTITD